MELRTTGDNINSWVTVDDCNVIIAEVPDSAIGYEKERPTDAFSFTNEDIPLILESQRQITALFHFRGERTNPLQRLAWPRVGFALETRVPTPNWFTDTFPHLDSSWADLAHHIHWDLGQSRYTELASDVVPDEIKEAAVINAALLKNGITLFEDNKGDSTAYSLGPISGDNINAVARGHAVFERLGRWGVWRGSIAKAGGDRG